MIIIIGILAAIAIPIFLNQRQKANEAACRSDLRNGVAAANNYAANQATGNFANMDWNALNGAPYNWRLSAPSVSPPTVNVLGGGTGFQLQITCTNAPFAAYHFDSSTTARVTDGPLP